MLKTQKFLRVKREELIEERAKLFYEKAMLALTKYKTEKRKDFEQKASVIMTDVYRKRLFREQMKRAIRDRQVVVNSISQYATYLRLRKLYICYTIAQSMMERAWIEAREKVEKRSAFTIQRIFRGFKARDKKMDVVLRAIRAK